MKQQIFTGHLVGTHYLKNKTYLWYQITPEAETQKIREKCLSLEQCTRMAVSQWGSGDRNRSDNLVSSITKGASGPALFVYNSNYCPHNCKNQIGHPLLIYHCQTFHRGEVKTHLHVYWGSQASCRRTPIWFLFGAICWFTAFPQVPGFPPTGFSFLTPITYSPTCVLWPQGCACRLDKRFSRSLWNTYMVLCFRRNFWVLLQDNILFFIILYWSIAN